MSLSINHVLFDLVLYAMLFTHILIVGLLWSTVEQQVFEKQLASSSWTGGFWEVLEM